MEYFHLTHKKNLKSILKLGILPSSITIPSHWESFRKHGLKIPNCIYTWGDETYKNEKYIKDMIYTKLFIHPRNNLIWTEDEKDDYIDYRKYGSKLYGDDASYYLLKISNVDTKLGEYIHIQTSDGSKFSTTRMMNDQYAHEDKPLYIHEDIIIPKNFKVIEKINTRVYKNNTLGFSFSKLI